jgi:hypothetical protein
MFDEFRFQADAPVTTGTSTVVSSAIDTLGSDSCTFVIRCGTASASNSLKVSQCDTSGGSYSDLASSAVSSGTNNTLAVSVIRPSKRFLKYNIVRAVTTTVDAAIVILGPGHSRPVTQPSGITSKILRFPSEGTA